MGVIQLSGFGYEVGLDPEHGAQMTHAAFAGKAILRARDEAESNDPLTGANFPLVPYSNRILRGRFSFNGVRHEIGRNWTGDANAIHGEGWRNAWQVVSQTATQCELSAIIEQGWPWRFEARQTVTLAPDGIEMHLSVMNMEATPFPAGLGMHPYFAKERDTFLRFVADQQRAPLTDSVPPFAPVPNRTEGQVVVDVSRDRLDDCFSGWNGVAEIIHSRSGRVITLEALEPMNWCVVFVPKDENYFCFEPVTHATGAFNTEDPEVEGVTVLAPGERKTIGVRISERAG